MPVSMLGWSAALVGSALLVAGSWVGAHYRRDLQAAQAQLESLESRIVETACGPIEVAVEGEGAPVLVVHGNGGGFDQGLGFARLYLGEGYKVIAPSRFGYLRTPLPADASPELQADAYACLLDALQVPRVALVTSSAGVTAAVQFALRHPERLTALVLHSPNAPGPVEMAMPPAAVMRRIFQSDFAFWALSHGLRPQMQAILGVPKGYVLSPDQEVEVRGMLASVLPVSARSVGMLFDTYVGNPAINSGYPFGGVRAPTLVVSAVDDPMALHANARRLTEAIPGAVLLAVPDGGHIMLGHAPEVQAAITAFLHRTQQGS